MVAGDAEACADGAAHLRAGVPRREEGHMPEERARPAGAEEQIAGTHVKEQTERSAAEERAERNAAPLADADSVEEACEHELLAERARKSMPPEEQIECMCSAFKVLGEPSRMKILLALMGGELCVYHIAEAVGGNQSNVSHQLRILKDARIVRSRRSGKNILYSVADEHVTAIVLMSRAHAECR